MSNPTDTFTDEMVNEGVLAFVGGVRCRTERQIVVARLARIIRKAPDSTPLDVLCTSQAEPIMMEAYGLDEHGDWYDLTGRQVKRLLSDVAKFNAEHYFAEIAR